MLIDPNWSLPNDRFISEEKECSLSFLDSNGYPIYKYVTQSIFFYCGVRIWAVSLKFKAYLQALDNLPFSIYMIFTGSGQTPFLNLQILTGSRESPSFNLQDFYRIWAVSLFVFTIYLQDLGSDCLRLSIYMKFRVSSKSCKWVKTI